MNPNPAPPPLPVTPQHNPYDFITQAGAPRKKGLLPNGGSKKQRILLVSIGLLLLATVAIVVIGVISKGDEGLANDYQSLVRQQAELIRVSGIGMQKAQRADAKNLAITTNYTLTSEQPSLLQIAKKSKAQTDPKYLALSKDSQTDAAFTTASQTNQFDEVFIKTMQTGLQKYQETLKKIYDETHVAGDKAILAKDYASISVLVGEQKQ